jgi:hypothetical protein
MEVNIGGGKVQTVKVQGMNIKISDFLEKIKANFYFNHNKRQSYLEIEE